MIVNEVGASFITLNVTEYNQLCHLERPPGGFPQPCIVFMSAGVSGVFHIAHLGVFVDEYKDW